MFPGTLRQACILFLAISFLPLLLVIVIGFVYSREESYREAEERIAALTRIAQLSQQRLIADVRQTLFVLAQAPAVARGDSALCSATLRDVMLASIVYSNLGAADADGNVMCNALPMREPVNIADRGYFQQAARLLDFGIGSYQIGRITGRPGINFAYPVRDYRQKRVMRMVYSAMDIAWLGTHLRGAGLPENARAWVFDVNGDVVASEPDQSWVGRSIKGTALDQALAGLGAKNVVLQIDDLDGVRRLYGIAPVWEGDGGMRLRVAVGIPVADAFVAVNRSFVTNLVLLLLGTAGLLVLIFRLLRRAVLRPIDDLVAAAGSLAGQDRDVRVAADTTIGEFSILGRAFNDMADAIGQRERDLAGHVVAVEQMNRRFEVLSAINQTIVRAEDEEVLLRSACTAIVHHGGGHVAWITRFDSEGREVLLASAVRQGGGDPLAGVLHSEQGHVRRRGLTEGTPVVAPLDDLATLGAAMGRAGWPQGASRYIGYPIMRQRSVFGALNIVAGDDALWGDAEGMALVREMAGDIGFALASLDKDSEIRHLAYHDPVSGLANQSELILCCEHHIEKATPSGALVPMLLVELHSLQQGITRFGHRAGDFVVRSIAETLRAAAPAGAVVARTGDRTFAVLFAPEKDSHTLPERIGQIFDALPTELHFGAQDIGLQFSAGVARYPDDGETAVALLQACTLALDSLGPGRSGVVAYHSARLSAEAQERWRIERHLARAVVRDELTLHYQPTRSLANGRLVGVEALLRWNNPELGAVSPGRFIPIAEQAGMINEIGNWVLGEGCRQMHEWVAEGNAPGYASVNVSVLQLYNPDFVKRVAGLFERFPRARGRIAMEITETAMMEDFALSERVLGELKELGIAIFVDDFGTGYSSLSYLRRLPVDTLKIDLVFTSELAASDEALSVVKAIVALAQSLGLSTVAEGIETREQETILASIGCDVGQGYHFGRPMPAGSVKRLFDGAKESQAASSSSPPLPV